MTERARIPEGTHLGHAYWFEGISYKCPSLKLYGYGTDVGLKLAIARTLMSTTTSAKRRCECSDPGCPKHAGIETCTRPKVTTLYRIDMDDESGTWFCEGCAEDASDSGLFRSAR